MTLFYDIYAENRRLVLNFCEKVCLIKCKECVEWPTTWYSVHQSVGLYYDLTRKSTQASVYVQDK